MVEATSVRLGRIGQIALTMKDLKKATAYYSEVLGMRLLFEVPGMSFFDLGGIRLMLGTAERPELQHPASILYFLVEDIDAATEGLKKKGVTFESEPRMTHKDTRHELWLAFFRDCEENLLALMSEVAIH